jgi:uncharacterized protein (TIGR02391 family)
MTEQELAFVLLEDMQARKLSPIGGKANRNSLGSQFEALLIQQSTQQNPQEIIARLNEVGRSAYAALEQLGLAEADDDLNGQNGYLVLTSKGQEETHASDLERVRVRGFLRKEMLHQSLRGKVFLDFANNEFDSAILEAFKTVEISVRDAAHLTPSDYGRALMIKAFAVGGPLSKPSDKKGDCEALTGLFAGALSRFRNPGAHSKRTFEDVLEAMEELMFASRLLRIVDERRRKA